MSLIYLGALLVSLAAMVLLDRRFRLVFWRDARRAAITLAVGLAFFLAWDAAGIALGIFARGGSRYMTGIEVAPELPLEEIFFLLFLCYLTLVLVFGGRTLLDRRKAERSCPTCGSAWPSSPWPRWSSSSPSRGRAIAAASSGAGGCL